MVYVHCYILTQKKKSLNIFRLNNSKQCSESSTRCCYCSTMSGIHLENNSFRYANVRAKYRKWHRHWVVLECQLFFHSSMVQPNFEDFFHVFDVVGRPKRSASLASVPRSRLNSANHFFQRNRFFATFSRPSPSLDDGIFAPRKAVFDRHTKSGLVHCFENVAPLKFKYLYNG